MSSPHPRFPQVLRTLRSAAYYPRAFTSILDRIKLTGLHPADLDAAWKLAFDLARREDDEARYCAEVLSAWCTRHTLKKILEKCIDG